VVGGKLGKPLDFEDKRPLPEHIRQRTVAKLAKSTIIIVIFLFFRIIPYLGYLKVKQLEF
jgi:hypothetical protein